MKYRMGSKTKEIQGINALVLVTKLKKHRGKTPLCCTKLKKHRGKTPLCWFKTTALIQPEFYTPTNRHQAVRLRKSNNFCTKGTKPLSLEILPVRVLQAILDSARTSIGAKRASHNRRKRGRGI